MKLTFVTHLFDITASFRQPSDISVSDQGLIYVVDGVNNKIKVFNQKGEFLFAFGKKGRGNGQFSFPMGIHTDSNDKVYVADSGNSRIQIFTPSGEYLSQIKLPSTGVMTPDPTDVAVNNRLNRLFVADNDNHQIHMYDLSSNLLLSSHGSPGAEKHEFRYPFLMSMDSDGYLYIVDVINTRVQVLNPDGKFVMIIGGWGVEKGNFFRPKGIALDSGNRVYVSDSYLNVIQVFETSGEFNSVIGDPLSRSVKKFISPVGIFIDKKDRLYVVEMFAERVSVYHIEKQKR